MRYIQILLLTMIVTAMTATFAWSVDKNKFPDVWAFLNYGAYMPATDTLDGKLAHEAPQEYFDKCKAGLIHGISLYNLKYITYTKVYRNWTDILDQNRELLAKNGTVLGPKAYAKVQEWKNRPHDMALLKDVNEYWNHSIEFRRDDPNNYSVDEWIGPYELEKRGGGDCEDYTIAKYFMLKELGFDTHDMRLIAGRKKETAHHAVLGVYLDGEIWLLNNVRDNIIPHTEYEYTVGVITENEHGKWAHYNN